MCTSTNSSPARTLLGVTDEEHTLILMMRTMRLDEIVCVMQLNKTLPGELADKHEHITNIINLNFQKSYQVHKIRAIIEFISTQPMYDQMFQYPSADSMIKNYQANARIESANVCELYLKPYTTECIQCKRQLKPVFSHRSKTVLSLTRTYKARKQL